ncbi:MAG TPA: tetratricopeptide repeat protein [Opitutaceae bacterium]|nr:tetratricopeptide repeat protein [Opitutaceae bacterium]
MTPSATTPATAAVLVHARKLLAESREADAAAWLERHASAHADALHREIATRAATTALQNREIAAATAWLERGLSRNPADPVLNFFRGNLHLDSGHAAEAVTCFRRCVAAHPHREEFVCNLGKALSDAGSYDEAITVLRTLPQSASAQLNIGVACGKLGDSHNAANAYREATRLNPEMFAGWLNLGGTLDLLDELTGALAAYNRAVALCPTSARAHLERGHVFNRLKRFDDAVASFGRCLAIEPSNLEARLAIANARLRLCDWQDIPSLRAEVIDPALASPGGIELLTPFFLLALPGTATQAELRRVAETRSARFGRGAVPLRAAATIPAGRPLRIGYVSPDFGNHAVGNCLRTLFARHDRSRVSVHAFSLLAHPEDAFRAAIRAGSDTWDDLHDLADRPAAEAIAAREIDVLVDLAGHTKANRIALFAYRPAPVQVTWLGYPGTTGASFIDHLLADEYLIPPEEEPAFSEHLIRLPGSYLPTDDAHDIAPSGGERAANALPESGFVFCAFNNAYKIEPLVFGAWMEILRRTPGSVLWLRGAAPALEANLRREAAARGIEPARLVFDPRSLPRAEHLARHRAAGLYLDTHFYNAHSTAADALWAGLPVLTFPGRSFPSRVGLSLVSTLGLADELVATSLEDYVERAVALAAAPDHLAALRARLAEAITRPGGLFDTAAFARKLESAFAQLCRRTP